ncbi:MAG: tRNA lysidine(34) synthetase TilS [Bacteroidota bacterium]|nr:tRNA lysidine(34) synthetase TilS [Bacteroidota bacterium]
MINKIQQDITNKDLFSKDNNLLLAISGGADSVCLFFVLKELGYNIELAHCNFNLRGKESDEDEYFVKELANKYGSKYHIKSFETQKYAHEQKISIQMAARTLRYKWFDELLTNNNLDFVITAHHKDDNVETFFINLIRGTGINGLCGIRAKNKNIIRPFLEISRQEIEHYLSQNNIKYRNDSSNSDVKYLRNKIRHQLMPLLKEMNPNIQQTIADEIFFIGGVNKVFQKEIDGIRERLLIEKEGVYRLNIADLIELTHLEVILFEILKYFGFSEINQIIKAISSQSGKQFFSDTYQIIIDREEIIISLLENPQDDIEIFEKEIEIQRPLSIKFSVSLDFVLDKNQSIAKLDFDKLSFPLRLRRWKNGDKFKPLGMHNFKKVSDFFIDEKYSLLDKQNQWILCSKNDIVWIVGNRIDDRYKIDTHTKKVYIAELLKED